MKISALITGASSGIGHAIAMDLARAGHQIFAGVRKQEDAERLNQQNPAVLPVILDVTHSTSIRKAYAQVEQAWHRQNSFCLINNAGIAVAGPIEAIEVKELRHQFDVNFFGLIETTQIFLPLIRESKGRIVNMSSVSGITVSPFLGSYSASKHAVEAASDALRYELERFGIKVIVIEPGPIKTPIWEKGLKGREEALNKMHQDRLSLYRSSMDHFEQIVEKIAQSAIPVERVAQVVHRALLEENPPIRQIVASPLNLWGVKMSRWLPDRIMDGLVRRQLFLKT